jgi:hypothetical protein
MEEGVVGQQNQIDDTGVLPERGPAQMGREERSALIREDGFVQPWQQSH